MQTTINNYLRRWGKNPYGQPLIRLVWSDYQREVRIGEFNEFHGSIYLRTVKGAKVVPKYPWIRERWVLERWAPPSLAYTPELPESRQGSYEPVYVFQDKWGNALELSLRVVELICSAMMNRPSSSEEIKQTLDEHLERKDREETHDIEEEIGAGMSDPIASSLSTGEGIGYGSNKGGR